MRSIYNGAKNYFDASLLLDEWIRDASTSDISELKSAAKTFLRNRDGILAYWSSGGGNNAATEGFNRKTRGLLEMSYGFHEFKPKFGSRGFRYCRIANEPVAFPVTGFVRSGT